MAFIIGGIPEEQAQFRFMQGKEYQIRVESLVPTDDFRTPGSFSLLAGLLGVHLGFMHQKVFEEDLLTAAIDAAKSADVVLVFVGNPPSWETEGRDMVSMSLPAHGSLDRLVSAVSAVNDDVVVINSTGVPISFYGFTASLPSYRPGFQDKKLETPSSTSCSELALSDTPTYGNFPGDLKELQVFYEEGIEIGYRYYDKHPEKVLFPFGFGLSYSKFRVSDVKLQQQILKQEGRITITAVVENLGPLAGSEIVQVYMAPPKGPAARPLKTLAGFAKLQMDAGQSKLAEIQVAFDSVTYWDETCSMWRAEKGVYKAVIGTSAANVVGTVEFTVDEDVAFMA